MKAVHKEALPVVDKIAPVAHLLEAATSEGGVAVAFPSGSPAQMHRRVLVDRLVDTIVDQLNLVEMIGIAALDWSHRRSETEKIPFHTIVSRHVEVKMVLGRRR